MSFGHLHCATHIPHTHSDHPELWSSVLNKTGVPSQPKDFPVDHSSSPGLPFEFYKPRDAQQNMFSSEVNKEDSLFTPDPLLPQHSLSEPLDVRTTEVSLQDPRWT